MKRLLCLWLPDWPIQRRQAAAMEQAQTDAATSKTTNESAESVKPIILWHADPRRGRVVAAACVAGRRAGVRLGMPIAQAADLAAMTSAIFEEYDRDADRQSLQSLAVEFQNHLSPQTAVESLERFKWAGRFRHDPEAILSEIQGVTHLFEPEPMQSNDAGGKEAEARGADGKRADGKRAEPLSDTATDRQRAGELGLLAAAATILQRRNLHGRLAIADTIGTAWALANFAAGRARPAQTCEFFLAPPLNNVAALRTLPCPALRLHPDTIATLERLGVDTLEGLLQLPRDGLATRLGLALCDRIAQALGEIEEPLMALRVAGEHTASLDLEYPSDAIDLIADRLTRLIAQATGGLHELGRGVLRLRCCLEFTQHPAVVLESGLFAPTLDQSHLCQLMLGALSSHRLGSKVTRIVIVVAQHGALASRQPSIFGPDFDASAHDDWSSQTEAARLIDALSGRLGEDCVRGVRVSDDPLPENSITEFPMTAHRMRTAGQIARRATRRKGDGSKGSRADQSRTTDQNRATPEVLPNARSFGLHHGPRTSDLGRRPLELYADPHPISVADSPADNPVGPGGDFPSRFRIRGRVRKVLRHWGPERIETRWWRGPLIRRDYFRIELDDGARLWIFYDLSAETNQRQWFLHGRFA